jgi:hypothetical protein
VPRRLPLPSPARLNSSFTANQTSPIATKIVAEVT